LSSAFEIGSVILKSFQLLQSIDWYRCAGMSLASASAQPLGLASAAWIIRLTAVVSADA
jgi:hypothetical protein